MTSLPHGTSYIVVTKEGDPILRPARARLIWAANTADATSALGLPCTLVGGVDAFTYRIENPAGKTSAIRALQQLYGVEGRFDLTLLHKDSKAEGWTANGDFGRYVLPGAGIVHTRDPRLALACVRKRIPYVLECHDEDYQKDFDGWSELFASPALCLALVAITEAVRDQMIEQGLPAQKIIVLDSGVNEATARRRPEAAGRWRRNLLGDTYRHLAVYTGGMQAERGIQDIFAAAEKMPEMLFVLCGGYRTDLSEWRRQILLQGLGNIRLFGYQNQEIVCELQQAADLVLFTRAPGGRPEVTSPLKLFEYLLSATPVVCARIPATNAYENVGLAARYYDAGDQAGLVTAIRDALEKHPYRPEGYQQNAAVGAGYTWVRRQRRLLDFIGNVHVKVTF